MLWMPHILFVIFGAVAMVPEWRRTALIICIASIANVIYQPLLEAAALQNDEAIILIHGASDTITILALLKWGSKGKLLQASALLLFVVWNLMFMIDYKVQSYLIYDSYMGVIFALNILQVLMISGGIYAMVNRVLERMGRYNSPLYLRRDSPVGPDREHP